MSLMVTMPVIVTMTRVTIFRFSVFRKLAQTTERSRQLCRPAKQGDASQHGDVNKLPGVVADCQAEQHMFTFRWRGNGTPDKHSDKHQQQDTDATASPKDRKHF